MACGLVACLLLSACHRSAGGYLVPAQGQLNRLLPPGVFSALSVVIGKVENFCAF